MLYNLRLYCRCLLTVLVLKQSQIVIIQKRFCLMIVTHSPNHVWYLTEVKLIISCNYISVIGLIYVTSITAKLCLKG